MQHDREVAAAAFMTGAFAQVLAPDASLTTDGFEVSGQDACALYLASTFAALSPDSIDLESINGEPGLAIRRGRNVVGVAILRTRSGLIHHVWLVTATEKLRSWN